MLWLFVYYYLCDKILLPYKNPLKYDTFRLLVYIRTWKRIQIKRNIFVPSVEGASILATSWRSILRCTRVREIISVGCVVRPSPETVCGHQSLLILYYYNYSIARIIRTKIPEKFVLINRACELKGHFSIDCQCCEQDNSVNYLGVRISKGKIIRVILYAPWNTHLMHS